VHRQLSAARFCFSLADRDLSTARRDKLRAGGREGATRAGNLRRDCPDRKYFRCDVEWITVQ
jgi:hypothetical protein